MLFEDHPLRLVEPNLQKSLDETNSYLLSYYWAPTRLTQDWRLMSNDRIAEFKNRINRSRKIRSAKSDGRIVERSHSSGRSTDTRLPRQ